MAYSRVNAPLPPRSRTPDRRIPGSQRSRFIWWKTEKGYRLQVRCCRQLGRQLG
ncbi:hypothetical protein RSAG8_07115, partial [Rhizoctonia solani AG-8 WAC10335]